MRFLPSLDVRDRRVLVLCGIGVLALALLGAFLLPNSDNGQDPLPSSYLAGRHGALAAYEALERSGYSLERWERPLAELVPEAGPQTVVIFAEPFTREKEDIRAVRQILERGGRVLSTGFWGGYLLPGGASAPPREFSFAACRLQPEGLDPLASSGEVWMLPEATWQVGKPNDRVQYSCAGQPAVVEYNWGSGHVVWWASATPLENGSIARGQNLDLLLNSLGPAAGKRFYWDESLHGQIRSNWSYAGGTALNLLRGGLLGVALLVLFSFSRRSGPVREWSTDSRAASVEFVEALGSLYRQGRAGSAVVAIAWENFRRRALRLCGMRGQPVNAVELAAVLRRRFPAIGPGLEDDLAACEAVAVEDDLQERLALRLVQQLALHLDALKLAAAGGQAMTMKAGAAERNHEPGTNVVHE